MRARLPYPCRDAIHKLFLRYKDPDSDQILAEGIAKLCEDLGAPLYRCFIYVLEHRHDRLGGFVFFFSWGFWVPDVIYGLRGLDL